MTETKQTDAEALKAEILNKVEQYYQLKFANQPDFEPGETYINYGGRVFDEKELVNVVEAGLDFWLTEGRFAKKFEFDFKKKMGVKYCSLTNSGSSANLLAIAALTSYKLGDKRLRKGDEVITVAAGFPTTVSPIIQVGAIPVFIDVELDTANIDCSQLEAALSDKTRAVIVAHTLGNPFDLDALQAFCKKHDLWLIEDNCDALGSEYDGKLTGTFGDIGTSSFYPPHHLTMGEGGAVYTNNSRLKMLVESFRNWGRDCWCEAGQDNSCKKRFKWQLGQLPCGYDHKYTFSHFGYNLKLTDMQAAIGCEQLPKLDGFVDARRKNWQQLYDGFKALEEFFILPKVTPKSNPSWFGFLLTVKEGAPFTRNDIVMHLEKNLIQTRALFAGNLLMHPCFDEMRESGEGYRAIGDLPNTNRIMNDSFWLGVYPGLSEEKLAYVIDQAHAFIAKIGHPAQRESNVGPILQGA